MLYTFVPKELTFGSCMIRYRSISGNAKMAVTKPEVVTVRQQDEESEKFQMLY